MSCDGMSFLQMLKRAAHLNFFRLYWGRRMIGIWKLIKGQQSEIEVAENELRSTFQSPVGGALWAASIVRGPIPLPRSNSHS
jgi:hypothetical protein